MKAKQTKKDKIYMLLYSSFKEFCLSVLVLFLVP